MKSDKIRRAIGGIDDDIIEAADKSETIKKTKKNRVQWIAVAAVFMTLSVVALTIAVVFNKKEPDPPVVNIDATTQRNESDTVDTNPTVTDPADTLRNIGGGEEGVCPVHDQGTYHSIPGELIEKVGEENFTNWLESLPADYDEEGCNSACNIVRFLQDFNFSLEEIRDLAFGEEYYSEFGNANIEALIKGDFDEFEKSFRIENYDVDRAEKVSSEWVIKLNLLKYLENSGDPALLGIFNEITSNGEKYKIASWSIAEIVYETGITQDVLEDIWHDVQYNEFLNVAVNTFDYDFSIIYEGDGLHKEIEELYPVQVDELLRK